MYSAKVDVFDGLVVEMDCSELDYLAILVVSEGIAELDERSIIWIHRPKLDHPVSLILSEETAQLYEISVVRVDCSELEVFSVLPLVSLSEASASELNVLVNGASGVISISPGNIDV